MARSRFKEQTFSAKVVLTQPSLVSTQWFKTKAEMSTLDDLRSTLETSSRELCASLRQCVDTPQEQVDTLWNLCDLNFLLDTWHPGRCQINIGSCAHVPQGLTCVSDSNIDYRQQQVNDNIPCRQLQSMWTTHEAFLDVVKNCWNTSSCWHPNPLVKLQSKMKSLKLVLKSWNFDTFGNVHNNSKAAEDELRAAEIAFDSSPSLSNRTRLHLAQAHVKSAQRCEDMFWCQKARTMLLDNGDKNTAFYHAVVQGNRRRNHISRLKVDGSEIADPEALVAGSDSERED
ncbi:hypothetical protein Taro_031808 [Colocasia esculenta]|uniref:Uncharacterized protein n=1 Tax=Colocasia esculenta TaxID=4460 RepID=A0A843W013_COLES|nr:hypothetical protein [Colocasia esculenta]